jgi:hypothetical protein
MHNERTFNVLTFTRKQLRQKLIPVQDIMAREEFCLAWVVINYK